MGRKPERSAEKKSKDAVALTNKGAWTAEEDRKLVNYVLANGDKRWRTLPSKAGLNRCGKSCRLRWLNYLRPGIKRGNITEDEEDLIIRLHNLLGNRWSLIAGRLPGRTDNEIKNHWNTHLSKKLLTINDLNTKFCTNNNDPTTTTTTTNELILPSALEEALLPAPTPHLISNNVAAGDQAAIQQLQTEEELEIGRLRVVGLEDDYQYHCTNTMDFETCHSPLGTWFQSFLGEFCGYNDLSSLLDNKDNCFLCFP